MKVFVWERVDQLTSSYHSGGGAVVFADTIERARQLAKEQGGEVCDLSGDPDDVREVEGGSEKVYIMPDAGCC